MYSGKMLQIFISEPLPLTNIVFVNENIDISGRPVST